MPGKLSTHALDLYHGRPAEGMALELRWLGPGGSGAEAGEPALLRALTLNADGRPAGPLLAEEVLRAGRYELLFLVGDYFARLGVAAGELPFLDAVPVRFGIADPAAAYHVPLLVTPWAYSTYRGS